MQKTLIDTAILSEYLRGKNAEVGRHVSAHAWGQDIKRAPSHDCTWPVSAPRAKRSYRFYHDALGRCGNEPDE